MTTAWFVTWLLGGLSAAAAAATLAHACRFNAATRYVAWWIAMTAVASFAWVFLPISAPPTSISEPLIYVDAVPDVFFSVAVGLWLAIALVKLVRLVPSLHAVYALRDRCVPFPVHVEAQLPLWQRAKVQGRAAELVICDELRSATVLGFQRPCIAVPRYLIDALTAAELDHVVLHEYAHVRRADDWTRLVQALVQSALWVHPAAALIGRQLDRERELACDEWVAAATGQPKTYAQSLARAAEVIAQTRPAPVLMPALFRRKHDVIRRIELLLTMREKVQPAVSLAGVAAAIVLLTVLSGLRAVPLVGEIGEIAAPLAEIRPLRALRPLTTRHIVAAAPTPAVRSRGPRAVDVPQVREHTQDQARPAETIHAGTGVAAAIQPDAPVEMLDARVIYGRYALPTFGNDAPHPSSDRPGTWTRVGTAASQIGIGAGKTGVSIGGMFSRAGTSLARRF
jgi:beta-lactamase regulating signal transducer with metallopeptidase domain